MPSKRPKTTEDKKKKKKKNKDKGKPTTTSKEEGATSKQQHSSPSPPSPPPPTPEVTAQKTPVQRPETEIEEEGGGGGQEHLNVQQEQPQQPQEEEIHTSLWFVWALSLLIGRRVIVETKGGDAFEGILHSVMPDQEEDDDELRLQDEKDGSIGSGIGVILRMAIPSTRFGCSADQTATVREKPIPIFVIRSRDFVQLIAANVEDNNSIPSKTVAPTTTSSAINSETFATDAEISERSHAGTERELTPWKPTDSETENGTTTATTLEEACASGELKNWDQFAENRRRFGVKSTYNEELYTTHLDRNSTFYRSHSAAAERTAKLIERESTSNVHLAEERGQSIPIDITEEEKYSAVSTNEATTSKFYVPPQRRAAAPNSNIEHRRPPPINVSGLNTSSSALDHKMVPHSPLSTTVHSASSPPNSDDQATNQPQNQSISPKLDEPPTLKLPRSFADGLFRPRAQSDTRPGRHPSAMIQQQYQLQFQLSQSASNSQPSPPMSPLSEPQRIVKTSSCESLARRSPVIEYNQTPNSPRSPLIRERMRLRQAVVSERFRSSSPTSGSHLSPLLSPLVDDPKVVQGLQLEVCAPTVSQRVLRDFQTFKLQRSHATTVPREAVFADLRKFQHDLSNNRSVHQQQGLHLHASASGDLFPSMVVKKHGGSPANQLITSPRRSPGSPLSGNSQPSIVAIPPLLLSKPTTTTESNTHAPSIAVTPPKSQSPHMPMISPITPTPLKRNPSTTSTNTNPVKMNPDVPSFNPNASSFTPKKPNQSVQRVHLPSVHSMFCEGMKLKMLDPNREFPEDISIQWPGIGTFNPEDQTPPQSPQSPINQIPPSQLQMTPVDFTAVANAAAAAAAVAGQGYFNPYGQPTNLNPTQPPGLIYTPYIHNLPLAPMITPMGIYPMGIYPPMPPKRQF